jgi:hypothetical protein
VSSSLINKRYRTLLVDMYGWDLPGLSFETILFQYVLRLVRVFIETIFFWRNVYSNHFVIVETSHHSRKDSVSTIELYRVQSGKKSEPICQMSFACFATQHHGSLASCIRLLKLFVSIHTVVD